MLIKDIQSEYTNNPIVESSSNIDAYIRKDFTKDSKKHRSRKNNPFMYVPDIGKGISTFNSLTEESEVGVLPDEKEFEITYSIYQRGNAVHTKDVTARTYDEAIEVFYSEMDEQNITPIIINCELVEG